MPMLATLHGPTDRVREKQMSLIVRESQIDFDQLEERVTPAYAQGALAHVRAAEEYLSGLRRTGDPGTHELLRALILVRNALEDALNED
jgi:hypothetical protein